MRLTAQNIDSARSVIRVWQGIRNSQKRQEE
jgi:hypothetical protein